MSNQKICVLNLGIVSVFQCLGFKHWSLCWMYFFFKNYSLTNAINNKILFHFQDEKAAKLNALNTRIEEVISHKESLICERKELMRSKMAKAEAKRQEHIEGIRKKAREEEAKLKEIAFINELNEQNARIDLLTHNQASDEKAGERLAELAEERAKKVEQRASKEAAAEERRRAMEAKR